MSSVDTVQFQYRCDGCWRELLADPAEAGHQIECPYCGKELIVPQPTQERVELARQGDPTVELSPTALSQKPVTAEQLDLADDPAALEKFLNQAHGYKITASRGGRLGARLVDGFLFVLTFGLGFLGALVLARMGLIDRGIIQAPNVDANVKGLEQAKMLITMLFPTLVLLFFQWGLIAKFGQTLGKKAFRVKIVTLGGGVPPGFVRGVILREWVNKALGWLPFYGLCDTLFIFSDSRRCLHDYLGGTKVVDVV